MEPLFPPWTNSLARAALVALPLAVLAVPLLLMAYVRSPHVTHEGLHVAQPVRFDHRHHVRDDGIDCLYCHPYATRGRWAGLPSTDVCMGCHGQIWSGAEALRPVLASAYGGVPIRWRRVHDLPDFVFFDHAAHVTRGVGCVTCHGRVDLMARVYVATPLTMGWCIDCHEEPADGIRPLDRVTDMAWAPEDAREIGAALARALAVDPPLHCSGCHR